MALEKTLSLIDIAGSEKRWQAYQDTAAKMLPNKIDKGRYMAMYLGILKGFLVNPKVTNKKSILNCAFNAPKLGLMPDPVFGQIYFIPYKGVLTYQIGYRGMITMADRAGLRVRAGLVYAKDEFEFYEDEVGQHFKHRPLLKEKERGIEICAYSAFQDVRTGFNQIQVMESFHIDEIKKMVIARMRDGQTPWKDPLFEPEMRKKTAIRRHAKTEPFSDEIARVTTHEENDERGIETAEGHGELEGVLDPDYPDPSSEAGKALSAELDSIELQQGELPFK